MPRVLIAGLFHETHTFLQGYTPLSHFQRLRGKQLLACAGDSSPLGGALECANRFGWEVVPGIDYRAQPSATVADEVWECFWQELAPLLTCGLDAVYLILHGAMVTATCPDVEGALLRKIRSSPGCEGIPIFGVFDLHAHFSRSMAEHANCLVAYRENPHTDAREAACTAAALLQRHFETGILPVTRRLHTGLIWPPTGTATAQDPMQHLEALARALEADYPSLWSVNVVAGFAFGDTPNTGVCFHIAHEPGAADLADAALTRLEAAAHRLHPLGLVVEPPVDEVLQKLNPLPPGLTVLAEPSDNIGGGAPGDGTGLLRALIRHSVTNAAVAIADPEAVAQAIEGRTQLLSIGGKGSPLDEGPLELEVEVLSKQDGLFSLEDKHSHLASMCGDTFDMGPCAVVRHRGITILLTSVKTPPFDLGQWRSQGIEPASLSVIGVKAAVAHRRAYDPIAARMLWVDTPGPCSSELKRFCYQHARPS